MYRIWSYAFAPFQGYSSVSVPSLSHGQDLLFSSCAFQSLRSQLLTQVSWPGIIPSTLAQLAGKLRMPYDAPGSSSTAIAIHVSHLRNSRCRIPPSSAILRNHVTFDMSLPDNLVALPPSLLSSVARDIVQEWLSRGSN